jgi:ABC-type phosphate/phosphonate transport system substrate-binding protein
VGAAKHSIYERVRELDPRVDRELIILAESPRVPSNGLLVRNGLPDLLKNKLKSVLLGLHTDPDGKVVLMQFGALKFIETTANDYQPVYEMAKKSGIDIMSYKYNNN